MLLCATFYDVLQFLLLILLFFRLYSEEELPAEFKLYLPVQQSSRAAHSAAAGPGATAALEAGEGTEDGGEGNGVGGEDKVRLKLKESNELVKSKFINGNYVVIFKKLTDVRFIK